MKVCGIHAKNDDYNIEETTTNRLGVCNSHVSVCVRVYHTDTDACTHAFITDVTIHHD